MLRERNVNEMGRRQWLAAFAETRSALAAEAGSAVPGADVDSAHGFIGVDESSS